MVKVYFETNSHAELIAVFENEQLYMKCLHALEDHADRNNGIITESICEKPLNQQIKD